MIPPSFTKVMPGLFVLLWSTGFIGAGLVMPHAEPFTFLTLRFVLAVVALAPLLVLFKGRLPGTLSDWGHAVVVGALVHAAYLGGVFWAIHRGFPAGYAALVVGLQPILTAVWAGPLLGEVITKRQWIGLGLGLVGVVLVLSEGSVAPDVAIDPFALVAVVIALFGITAATLYQKRFGQGSDLLGGSIAQFIGAGVVCGLMAVLFQETGQIDWTGEFLFGLAWLVLVLSVGAVTLLLALIRLGAASKVAGLFYLVPPTTALIAFVVFDERLGLIGFGGFAIAALGVYWVIATPKQIAAS